MGFRPKPNGWGLKPPEWHFEKLLDFARKKRMIGEPGSNITLMSYFCKDQSLKERAWRLGCYCAAYCLPTANIFWQQATVDTAEQFDWKPWLTQHWPGIVTRQERRCVRTPEKMTRCLTGVARWVNVEFPVIHNVIVEATELDPRKRYEEVWGSVTAIPFFGRYISTRYMEGLKRYCEINTEMPDMRNSSSGGGWSPKTAMTYLYPQYSDQLLDESGAGDGLADQLVEDIIARFAEEGFTINYYQLAAILCDYRGSYEHRHEYPGWDLDIEPTLYTKVVDHWGEQVLQPFYEGRSKAFPVLALGELNGWHGVRKQLATTLRDHGYNWSDIVYDYKATTDLRHPVRRS